jgi:hypothetical protein
LWEHLGQHKMGRGKMKPMAKHPAMMLRKSLYCGSSHINCSIMLGL